jgi:hypothetical protein
MLRLFNKRSGAQDVELVRQVPAETWGRLKRNLVRLLREAGCAQVIAALEADPFELWDATNGFNDEFSVLFASVSARRYVELEQKVDRREDDGEYDKIAYQLEKVGTYIRFILVDVMDEGDVESVSAPTLKITSSVVEHALNDAEALIRQRGAVSGLDRVHTAFHGYLKAICDGAGLLPPGDPGITDLFKVVRRQHPALQPPAPGSKEIDSILGPLATIVNALNPLRNRSSVAHPNEELLEEPEAMLVINAVRTLLHYLNSRIGM